MIETEWVSNGFKSELYVDGKYVGYVVRRTHQPRIVYQSGWNVVYVVRDYKNVEEAQKDFELMFTE